MICKLANFPFVLDLLRLDSLHVKVVDLSAVYKLCAWTVGVIFKRNVTNTERMNGGIFRDMDGIHRIFKLTSVKMIYA